MKPLTERDLETLNELEGATDSNAKWGRSWSRVMDCGGSNGSHHGGTLMKLHARGFCDQHSYGHLRKTRLYRINAAGRGLLIAWRNDKRTLGRTQKP